MSEESKKSEVGGSLGPKERWSARRKREVVLRLLRAESVDDVSREVGVEAYRLEQWRDQALGGIDQALKSREGDPLQTELDQAKRHIGELSMQVELLERRVRRPLASRRSRK